MAHMTRPGGIHIPYGFDDKIHISLFSTKKCEKLHYAIQCESKNPPSFSDIFPKRLGIFSPSFTCLLYVPIYAGLQIFIQLSATLMKLCHIKPVVDILST